MDNLEQAKKAAGEKAASLIKDGMTVGLGTGSTAYWFIETLSQRKLNISAVASSSASLEHARAGNIPIADLNTLTCLDVTVDGADEIDSQRQMIKGGGGALLREKILASMSKQVIIIVDETKLVSQLGKCKLPVEILPFGYNATIHKINLIGFSGSLRKNNQTLYLTENGNYIYDIQLDPKKPHPSEDHQRLIQIPGVVETGFFFNLATQVIVGFKDGRVELV